MMSNIYFLNNVTVCPRCLENCCIRGLHYVKYISSNVLKNAMGLIHVVSTQPLLAALNQTCCWLFSLSERISRGKESHELHMCERNTVLTTNQVRKMNDMYQTRHQLSVCIRYPWDTEKWIVKKQGVAVMFNGRFRLSSCGTRRIFRNWRVTWFIRDRSTFSLCSHGTLTG